jgi:hypothetical protein
MFSFFSETLEQHQPVQSQQDPGLPLAARARGLSIMDELEKALEIKDDSNESHALAASTDAAPLFSEYYPDWAAFDQAVATAIERHHPIRKRSSLTFEVYNRTVSKGLAASNCMRLALSPFLILSRSRCH